MAEDWKPGDIAVATQSATCGCGQHSITQKTYYRVYDVHMVAPSLFGLFDIGPEEMFLDVLGGDAHVFHHSLFRKERPADKDIFKLCQDTPLRVTEDA